MHFTIKKCISRPQILLILQIQFIIIPSRKGKVIRMGFGLLAVFIIMETALLALTFTKQKEKVQWLRNRVIFRAGEVIVFLLALLLPQVAWDFRWKLCFYMLLFRVVTSLIFFLIKHKKASGNKSRLSAVANACGGIVVLGSALIPSFLFTGYQGLATTGMYEVEQTQAILIDPNRTEGFRTDGSKREVPIYFYYPKAENPGENSFPLIIFSHGAFGYYQSNTSTYMELASHGYVVVSLDHPYHSFFTKNSKGELVTVNPSFIQSAMMTQAGDMQEEEEYELTREWIILRTADMNFVLDTLIDAKTEGVRTDTWYVESDEMADEILQVLVMTNTDHIGLMGHSLGGATSVTTGRMRDDIDAVVDIDGTMLGEQVGYADGVYEYYEESYPVPLLSIDNESHYRDGVTADLDYVNNVVLENAADSHHTYFLGSGHMNFTDLPLFSPPLASLLETGTIDETECVLKMNEIILQYFDHYLKGEGELSIRESY